MTDIPFVKIPKLDAPTLNKYDAVTTEKGTPSGQFQRWWQSVLKSIRATTDAISRNQQILQEQATYQAELNEWLQDLSNFTLDRVIYLQLAVSGIAIQGGFTVPDPGGLPVHPGPPPDLPTYD